MLSPEEQGRLKKRATMLALVVGLTILGLKGAAWMMTGATSILTAALDSVLDNGIAVVNFMAVRQALKPASRSYRFGFGKLEPLAGLMQAAFIFGIGLAVIVESIDRLRHPVALVNADMGIGAMVLATVMMIGMIIYQRHVVRCTGSLVVRADSIHYQADVMMHLSIIASLALSHWLTASWIDPVATIGIAVFLMWNARTIAADALAILVDKEIPEEDRKKIRQLVLAFPQVANVHDLRTRSSGSHIFVQLHLELDGDLTLAQAHDISEAVIEAVARVFPNADTQIHQEPVGLPRDRSWCGGGSSHRSAHDGHHDATQ
ncbi:cation-efflux pump FieF [Magnetospira sp. QH-2]|nr:cation-efflux pump FieF [Magnetospira sp. QH-2]